MAESSSSVCVTPLSSPYSLLPRTNTYLLAATLLIPFPRGWVYRAALAGFTTRTAIFAVDAVVILATLQHHPNSAIPVDALAASESLTIAVIVATWLLLVSKRMNESRARDLIRGWSLVVGVGSIVAFVAVGRLGGQTGSDGDCEGIWINQDDLLGSEVLVPVLGPMGSKIRLFSYRIGIPGLLFAVTAICSVLKPRPKPRTEKDEPNLSTNHDWEWTDNLFFMAAKYLAWLMLPAMAIYVVISSEQYFFQVSPGIPVSESMASVGQWGVWAATGAVLTATLINTLRSMTGMNKEAQKSHFSE